MPINPDWVFIDLDDTLWDFSANSNEALRYIYSVDSYLYNYFESFDEFADKYHIENDRLWHLYHHGKIDSAFLKAERFRATIAGRLDDTAEIEKIAARLNDEYLDVLSQQTRVDTGAFELLEYLKDRYMIGVLSNGFINVQYKKLYSSGLWKYVQRMIVSDEIGINKPDRRIFDYALAETGATAERSVMIGDNPDADIAGAVNAGWSAIYYNKKGKECNVEGVPEITRLSDAINLL